MLRTDISSYNRSWNKWAVYAMSESERKSAFASAHLVVLKKGQTMANFGGFKTSHFHSYDLFCVLRNAKEIRLYQPARNNVGRCPSQFGEYSTYSEKGIPDESQLAK